MNKRNIDKVISSFVNECENLGYGMNKHAVLGDFFVSVWRDGKDNIEFGNLFDIHTYNDESMLVVIDDEIGIYIDNLEEELRRIIYKKKEFNIL